MDRSLRRGLCLAIALGWLVLAPSALAALSPTLAGSVADSTNLSGTVSVAVSGHYAYTPAYFAGQLTAVDIADPAHPAISGWSGAPTSPALDNNLTAASTVNVAGGYAFVVSKNRNASQTSDDDGTGNSLTILDIHTDPAQPSIVGTVRDTSKLFGAYGVAVSGSFAYVAYQGVLPSQPHVPDTSTGGFSVIDITNPAGPTIVANIDNGSLPSQWTNALNHATSVSISGHYAFVTAFNSANLTVIDISNPTSPTIVGMLHDATHMALPNDVAVQGRYAFVADQTGGSADQFTVVDVSDPTNPTFVSAISNPNVLAGDYRVRLRGNFAFVAGSSAEAVAAIDISNPASPRVAGFYQSSAQVNKVTGLDVDPSGRYVVASSPLQSTEHQNIFPPYPLQPNGPTETGTISVINLDPAPISVSIAPASEPADGTTQTSASFSFSVNDTVSTVQCQLDGAPFTACTTPTTQTYGSLAPGSHTFVVQATDAAGNPATASYTWTVDAPPQNTAPPTVSGNPLQGQVLTATTGAWSGYPTPTESFQWQRCDQTGASCAPISGATASTYTLLRADMGSTIEVVVSATNALGSSSATSAPTSPIAGPPRSQSLPTISGTAVQGSTLTATSGSWSGYPAPTFKYAWQRCNTVGKLCSPIPRAKTAAYTVTASDVGATLRVFVTATNSAGSVVARSAPTAVVTAASTATATLTGVAAKRTTLRVVVSAARGLLIKQVAIALSGGPHFAARERILQRRIAVSGQGRRLRIAAHLRGRTLVITLRKPSPVAQIAIARGGVTAPPALIAKARRRHPGTVAVVVTVLDSRGLTTRRGLRIPLR